MRHEIPLQPDFSIPDITEVAVTLAAISYGLGVYDAVISQATASLCEVPPPDQGYGEEGLKAVMVVKGTLLRGMGHIHNDETIKAHSPKVWHASTPTTNSKQLRPIGQ